MDAGELWKQVLPRTRELLEISENSLMPNGSSVLFPAYGLQRLWFRVTSCGSGQYDVEAGDVADGDPGKFFAAKRMQLVYPEDLDGALRELAGLAG